MQILIIGYYFKPIDYLNSPAWFEFGDLFTHNISALQNRLPCEGEKHNAILTRIKLG